MKAKNKKARIKKLSTSLEGRWILAYNGAEDETVLGRSH